MRVAEKHLNCGPEGCGKTFKAHAEAQKARRLISVDLNDQPSLAAGAIVIDKKSDLVSLFKNSDGRKKIHVCYRGANRDGPKAAFEWACQVAAAARGVTIFADEAETLIDPRKDFPDIVRTVMKRGRHVQVPLFLTSQRPQDLHAQVRSNVKSISFFRGYDATYVSHIQKILQMPGDSRSVIKALKELGEYEYILSEVGAPWKIMKKYKKT